METLTKITITDAVVDYFRKKIQNGELKVGDKLPSERVLMKQLGISRFSLREGLARLSALGVIETFQGKGAFITNKISDQAIRDIILPVFDVNDGQSFVDLIEARTFLETELARKAANLRTNADIDKLRQNLESSKLAYNDPEKFANLDYEFHQIISDISNNRFFWRMQQILHVAVYEFISENVKSDSTRLDAINDHIQIIQDIVNQDVENITISVANHISVCVKHFKERYPRP